MRIARLRVGVLVDRQIVSGGRLADHAVDRHVLASLRRQARYVALAPFTTAAALRQFLDDGRFDLVFNLTEHVSGDRTRDSHVCMLLELYGIPYTGSCAKGLMLCRDKMVSKLIAAREGFRIPWCFVPNGKLPEDIRFPLVVKPRLSDSSEGIGQRSLVNNREALLRRIEVLRRRRTDEIICEEYIGGREMVVGMFCGRVMPARELIVGRGGPAAPRIFSARLKQDPDYRKRWSVRVDAAQLTRAQSRTLATAVRRTSAALHLRDYGRIDFKLAPDGSFVFIEANPNPPLVPFRQSFAGTWSGVDFDTMVARITCAAARRAAD
jgi:D-alanine-D-alanine ligase